MSDSVVWAIHEVGDLGVDLVDAEFAIDLARDAGKEDVGAGRVAARALGDDASSCRAGAPRWR